MAAQMNMLMRLDAHTSWGTGHPPTHCRQVEKQLGRLRGKEPFRPSRQRGFDKLCISVDVMALFVGGWRRS